MERRKFIRNSALGIGAGVSLTSSAIESESNLPGGSTGVKLPREVWVATFTLTRVEAETYDDVIDKVLGHMEDIINYKPDIICLPELFPFISVPKRITVTEAVGKPLEKVISRFSEFSKKYKTYIICPVYTEEDGKYYNSAIIFDREGEILGEYRKIHTTVGEMGRGVSPGPLDPLVFKTDFGTIGVQICFDLEWDDGWKKLREKGAEIVFFCSAYSGGLALQTKAWQNKYSVVSSTMKGSAKICDITGQEIAKTGRWERHWAIAPINLEKAFLHSWPYFRKFKDIKAKYGRKVKITNFDEEEWSIIESLSPDVKIADIIEEFDLKTHEEAIKSATDMQIKLR
jgi:predicted amidohydrolase